VLTPLKRHIPLIRKVERPLASGLLGLMTLMNRESAPEGKVELTIPKLSRQDITHERLTNWLFASSVMLLAAIAIGAVASVAFHPVSLHTCTKVLLSIGHQLAEAVSLCLAAT